MNFRYIFKHKHYRRSSLHRSEKGAGLKSLFIAQKLALMLLFFQEFYNFLHFVKRDMWFGRNK
jgi:hypothetical protein